MCRRLSKRCYVGGCCWCLVAAAVVPFAMVALALLEKPIPKKIEQVPQSPVDTQEDLFNAQNREDQSRDALEGALEKTFDRLAPVYDITNKWLSLGLDRRWRDALVHRCLRLSPGDRVLDIATGTAEIGLSAAAHLKNISGGISSLSNPVIGLDPSEGMLRHGLSKAKSAGLHGDLQFFQGRAEDIFSASNIESNGLIITEGSIDKIAIAFGIRHVANIQQALRQAQKVLHKPSGRVCILDYSLPAREDWVSKTVRQLITDYLVPLLGKVAYLASPDGNKQVAARMADSALAFSKPSDMAAVLGREGLSVQTITSFAFGTVHLYEAVLSEPL